MWWTNFFLMLAINHADYNYFINIVWNHLLSPMEQKNQMALPLCGGIAVYIVKLWGIFWCCRNTMSNTNTFSLKLQDDYILPKDCILHITWNTSKEIQRSTANKQKTQLHLAARKDWNSWSWRIFYKMKRYSLFSSLQIFRATLFHYRLTEIYWKIYE